MGALKLDLFQKQKQKSPNSLCLVPVKLFFFFFFFRLRTNSRIPLCVVIDFLALSTRPWSAFFFFFLFFSSVNLRCHRKRSQVTVDVTVVYD